MLKLQVQAGQDSIARLQFVDPGLQSRCACSIWLNRINACDCPLRTRRTYRPLAVALSQVRARTLIRHLVARLHLGLSASTLFTGDRCNGAAFGHFGRLLRVRTVARPLVQAYYIQAAIVRRMCQVEATGC